MLPVQRQQRAPLALWAALLLLLLAPAPPHASAIRVHLCFNGGTLEYGLCYKPCPLGWTGLACTCWKGIRSQWRGCGSLPTSCEATSFAPAQLPPVGSGAPFTLVLSADPQLYRVSSEWR